MTTCSEADIAHNIGIFLQLKPHLPTPDWPAMIPAEWTLTVDKGPWLFLPTLSALAQGPGFANLSCLGEVSDRILACYIDSGSADSESGSEHQTGGEVRGEIHVG